MRLTVEIVQGAAQRLNPVGDREILLRGYKIPTIENTGTLRDAFDCLDLSDNEIQSLGNFAKSSRLKVLFLNNNNVSRIDPNLADELPNLETLVLTGNKIGRLSEVDAIAKFAKLRVLSLLDNPICRSPHYRPYVISKAPPSLKLLDFRKIKTIERVEARKLFPLDGPPAIDVTKPPPPPPPRNGPAAALRNLTDQQRAQIRAAVQAARTPEEVDALERQLRAGIIPPAPSRQPRPPPGPPPGAPPKENGNGRPSSDLRDPMDVDASKPDAPTTMDPPVATPSPSPQAPTP
ncbi:hypothetical protein CTAYLR_002056 [Chrysophaeum taylorii]|uniref:Uncharacterized protein n=1 Tax=Chrysophaeum taylorii TaxID=2483200 RepID=A0AAD7XPX8_9STRA|nr:hypothetical protein CTAYLR_002056 [Chrysophaeum taylorii]